MKRRLFVFGLLVLILSLLLVACGGDEPQEDTPAAPAATQPPAVAATEAPPAPTPEGQPIVVGASLPLTARFSEPGTAAKQGYEVWAEMVNESGGLLGRPVELIIYDNASDQDTAVADYEKLITVDEVDLVVGPFSSFLVIPSSEVAARYGYAFVEPAGGAPDVFNRGLDNIFFAQPAPGNEQAIPYAEYILGLPEADRPQTFAIVTGDDPFALSVMENAKELLLAGGLELVFEEIYPVDLTDFSAIAIQLADLDPDLIVGGTALEDSVNQIRGYQDAGYQPRGAFFTTGPSVSGPFKEALGDATEGVMASISWFPEGSDYQNAEMGAKYVEMFGGEVSGIAEDTANAFTVGQVLQQAVENIGSIDNAALIVELHSSTFDTVVGPLSFDEVGRPQGAFMLLQWQGDRYVIVGPAGREQAPAIWPKPAWETGGETPVIAAPEGEPIVVGASLPLTARFSEPGTAAKQGYEVWAEMVNESGGLLGRPVELIIYDNASDQDTAVADYEKLITVDEVDLVVGPFSSFLVIPSSEVAARYGYAFVEPAGGAPDVFNRGLDNIFFAQPAPGNEQAIPYAEYILGLPEADRPQTFAIVTGDDPFALSVMENAKELLLAGGLELVFEEIYPVDLTDFSAIAIQLADLDPDLIVGGTALEDSVNQIRGYQDAGYQPRGAFFTTGPSVSVPFKEALGDATEGVMASISWFPEGSDYQNAEMGAKYVEMFGGEVSGIAEDTANAFTVGQVLQQAVENIGSIDNAALIVELHSSTFDTVVGPLSFDEVGRPQGAFMLLQWQGDRYVIVGPAGREQAPADWPKAEW